MAAAIPFDLTDYTDPRFGDLLLELLRRQPLGISEYELLKQVRKRGYLQFMDSHRNRSQALYLGHFLLFHALYRLRDLMRRQQREDLQIGPLCIRIEAIPDTGSALTEPDHLRGYYLDLGNLDLSPAQVEELIDQFWKKLGRHEQRSAALAVLDLQDPVDDSTIRQRYRRLVSRHHPDRGGQEQRMKEYNLALDQLLRKG